MRGSRKIVSTSLRDMVSRNIDSIGGQSVLCSRQIFTDTNHV